MKDSDDIALKCACAAGLICLLVYLRALSCDFVNLDDPFYVYENPAIKILDLQFIYETLTTSYMGWWMPLTWISLAVDHHFWGLNPVGYHLTNILLHAASTVLVVLVADNVLKGVRGSTFEVRSPADAEAGTRNTEPDWLYPAMLLLAGLLWGIHPLRVESVAWVTERKDVLSGVFSLGSILCYLRYVRGREGAAGGTLRPYLLSLLLLVPALMSKPVSVVVPAMFLVMDWYPLGRLQRGKILAVLREKIPFLLLAAVVAAATIRFAAGETILVSFQDFPLHRRLILAGNALIEYCRMSLYPVGLVHLYLLPQVFPVSFYVNAALSLLVSCLCIVTCRTRPWFLAVWILFLLPLLPVLGIFQNGAQSHADRFTYLPSVAPSIAAAVLFGIAVRRLKAEGARRSLYLLAVLLLLFYGGMTLHLIGAWKDSETLWTRLIRIQPVGRAYYYRGEHYLKKGDYPAAIRDLQVSIRMAERAGNPEVLNLYALKGYALSRSGRYEEAVQDYTVAISGFPEPNFFYHRGVALKALGRVAEAEEDFHRGGAATGPIEWHRMW